MWTGENDTKTINVDVILESRSEPDFFQVYVQVTNFTGRYIEMRMRRVHLSMRTESIKAFSKRIRRCSVDGRKRYENDNCGRNFF